MTQRILKDKTIGEIIKSVRLEQKISIDAVHHELKIKVRFLEYIENNEFAKFDSHTQAKGFIRNYAKFLGLKYDLLVAMYRRDVENIDMKRVIIPLRNDDDEIAETKLAEKLTNRLKMITITKRKVLTTGAAFLLLVFTLILSRLLINTFEKPFLVIDSPFEIASGFKGRIEYGENQIIIDGRTENGTVITVNDAPVFLKADYTFTSDTIPLTQEVNVVIIQAENNLGAKSKIELLIIKKATEIKEMSVVISSPEFNSKLFVKADDIVKLNGWLLSGEELTFSANRYFEIDTQTPEYLQVEINGERFKLNKGVTNYVNNITEITIN